MKKISRRILSLTLVMVMLFSGSTVLAAETSPVSETESVVDESSGVTTYSFDSAPFIYNGSISTYYGKWTPKYSMRVSGASTKFKLNFTANSGSSVAVEVFNSSGTSLGMKTYNLTGGVTSATFTYGTLAPGSYTYRFLFTSGSGTYILMFGV